MKKINKYLFGAFAALLSAGLFSCVEEAPEYVAGEPDQAGCYGIYFPTQEASGDHTFDPTMARVIPITLMRDSLKGTSDPLPEIEVAITSSDTTGIFVVPSTAKFADGQTETTINVTFEKAADATKYPLSLSIEDPKNRSIYNSTSNYIDLSVFCVKWEWFGEKDHKFVVVDTEAEASVFNVTFDWFEVETPAKVKYYEVGDYRTAVMLAQNEAGFFGTKVTELHFTWNTKNNDLYVDEQYMGWDYANQGEGDIPDAVPEGNAEKPVYFYDWFSYWFMRGQMDGTAEAFFNNSSYRGNYPPSYYDGNGGFIFNLKYFIPKENGGWTGFTNDFRALADGFIRVDYSIDVEAGETVDGVVPVEFTLGTDVDTVKYVIVEGELNASGLKRVVNNIAENKAENVVTFKAEEQTDTIIGIQAEKTGVYSIVALTIIKGEVKESASTSFTYVTLDDKDEYAAVVTVATEPTSAMYEHVGLNAINSFGYFVYGKDLTEVKVGVFKTADVQAKGAEALAASIKTALSDSIVNIINGTGYATLATGLDALTSYSVVVYATNGYNSTVVTAEYETDGLPNEPTGITGTYTYAYFWEGDDPGLALLINPNYENTYAINNWGGGIDMNFVWDKETNKCIVKDQFTGYVHSTYGDVWVDELGDYAGNYERFGQSYYDPETETFHFNVIYYVSAGNFPDYGEELFALDSQAEANARRLLSFSAPANKVKAVGAHGGSFKPERNPQTVAFKAVAVERPARSNRFSAPVKLDNSMLKF